MEEQEKKLKIKRLVNGLKKIRGRHTELVTIYVPSGYDINLISNQVSQEISTAQNIKSKQTRKNVVAALEKILQEVKGMKKTPPNGLAIFCGNISETDRVNIELRIVEPPEPIATKLYRCDQTFVLEPLQELIEAKYVFGLIVIDKEEAGIGFLKGKVLMVVKTMKSMIPGKMRAGGQSAARFGRVRKNLIKAFYKEVGEEAKNIFKASKTEIRGILVGGPGPTKEEFVDGHGLKEFEKKIIAIKDIGYSGEFGLQALVDSSKDVLAKEELIEEKEKVGEFLEHLSKEDGLFAYGVVEVEKALDFGAVKLLLISETIKQETIDTLVKKAKESNTEVYISSTDSKEGNQLRGLGGIAAVLRFKLTQ